MPSTLADQAECRRLLEAVLHPWPVTRWEQADFGIDAVVEISSVVPGTADREASGKLFAVQLKSTRASEEPEAVRLTTGHLRYWFNHSLPVLLVSAHLASGRMRFRWIDDSLLSELRDRAPTFWSQETIAVSVPDVLDRTRQPALESFVGGFRPRERTIHPSRFFDLRERVLRAATALESAAHDSGVQSVQGLVEQVRRELKATAYLVAIAGPARVGKSTLVNALLGLDVSPVADYPTTAVPLQFDAGDHAQARIVFADGVGVEAEPTSEALRPFAAQQLNEANVKEVRLVQVTLPNEMLARGISLVDTPGLHDASDAVREVTQAALKNADAVLYVLDASLGSKFSIGKVEVDDLTELQRAKERVIVVLNQSDGLAEDQHRSLQAYVEQQLRRYRLLDALPTPPLFVSGRDAWDARSRGVEPPAAFLKLENELWGHLLRNRATGIHRLASATARLFDACESAAALLSLRSEKGNEARQLDRAAVTCQTASRHAVDTEKAWRRRVCLDIDHHMVECRGLGALTLSRDLDVIPLQGAFPTAEQLRVRLEGEIRADAGPLWSLLRQETAALARDLSEIAQRALGQARTDLGIPIGVSLFPPPPDALPAFDLTLPEAHLGFWGGLLGFLVNPVVGIATTFFGWAIGHDVAIKRRRKRALAAAKEAYAAAQESAYSRLAAQAHERVAASGHALVDQIKGRLQTFIGDARRRMGLLGNPLSSVEADRIGMASSRVATARAEVEIIGRDLTSLVEGVTSA